MFSFNSTTYSKRLLHLISWSHWFTFFNILTAIGLSSFYLFNETLPDTLLGQIYTVTNWFSHMSFLTFIGFVLIIFPLTLIYPNTKFIRTTASIVFTLGLLLLLLDAYIYSQLGYHLNASSNDQIVALIQSQIQDNRAFWFISILLAISILAFQLIVSNYAWKHLRQLQNTKFAKYIVMAIVGAFFFSHITHIWADANLEYDVLRQDTVLPMSYPSTAKTLLTKYGLFNKADYIVRKNSPLSLTDIKVNYPQLSAQCLSLKPVLKSAFIVVTDTLLTAEQITQFSYRNNRNSVFLTRHIDNALPENSWFNMFFSLPNIYKDKMLQENTTPLMFEVIENNKLAKTFTVINDNLDKPSRQQWPHSLFDQNNHLTDISQLILAENLNNYAPGLHVFYFKSATTYQFELFIDALLLTQKLKSKQQQPQDIIWISSIGNQQKDSRLTIKPAILMLADNEIKKVDYLTSHMDIQPTLMSNWLSCNIPFAQYSNGDDMLKVNKNRVIANTIDKGIIVSNKDKSVFIDQNGNFQSYSRQLRTPIAANADFPLMIDGVNFIKQFALRNKNEQ